MGLSHAVCTRLGHYRVLSHFSDAFAYQAAVITRIVISNVARCTRLFRVKNMGDKASQLTHSSRRGLASHCCCAIGCPELYSLIYRPTVRPPVRHGIPVVRSGVGYPTRRMRLLPGTHTETKGGRQQRCCAPSPQPRCAATLPVPRTETLISRPLYAARQNQRGSGRAGDRPLEDSQDPG